MSETSASSAITLPPGVRVGPGRETSQTDHQGMIVQGMVFPITLPSGSTTSVFVPYSQIHDTAAVKSLIDERVRAVMAISG